MRKFHSLLGFQRWGSQVERSRRSLRYRGSAGLRGGPLALSKALLYGDEAPLQRLLYWSSDGSTLAGGKAVGLLEGAAYLKEVGRCVVLGLSGTLPLPSCLYFLSTTSPHVLTAMMFLTKHNRNISQL